MRILALQPPQAQKGEGFSKVLPWFQGASCSPAKRVLWQQAAPRFNQARDESSRTRCLVNDARLLRWCFVSLSSLCSSNRPGSLTQTDFYMGYFPAFWQECIFPLFLGEDTWIINFPCILSEFVILLKPLGTL